MSEIEPSRDAELWHKQSAWIELVEGLLGPFGAITRFVRAQILRTTGDDAQIDVQQLIVRTIDQLEMPHIAALTGLDRFNGTAAKDQRKLARELVTQMITIGSKATANPIFETLHSQGLLDDEGTMYGGGQALFQLSEYGKQVLAYLSDAAEP